MREFLEALHQSQSSLRPEIFRVLCRKILPGASFGCARELLQYRKNMPTEGRFGALSGELI